MKKAVDEAAVHSLVLLGKPIQKHGLEMWGLPMRQYEEWAKCKNVWLTRQSTLPVFCIQLSFLDAMFRLDIEAIKQTGKPAGWLYNIMYCLGLSLRFGEDCVKEQKIHIVTSDDEEKLKCIRVNFDNGKSVDITPAQFKSIRKIVAWAQGETLPDETLNSDLVETEELLSQRSNVPLVYSLTDLKASVALACGSRIKDINEWPILEFETMRRAIDRNKKYLICGIGSTNGCSWDGGNPYPSWCFDRNNDNRTTALISQARFGKSKK